jgi:hypothetical protein
MSARFQVISPAPAAKNCCNVTPVEALHIAEDLRALELAIQQLRSVDPINISASDTQAQRDFAHDMQRSTLLLIETWRRYATRRLRKDFLVL